MPTDRVGSPAEVQDARSTEKSAAAMARLSPFARRDTADFKTKFPLDVRLVRHWRDVETSHRNNPCPRTGNETCVKSASLKVIRELKVNRGCLRVDDTISPSFGGASTHHTLQKVTQHITEGYTRT